MSGTITHHQSPTWNNQLIYCTPTLQYSYVLGVKTHLTIYFSLELNQDLCSAKYLLEVL